MRAKVTSHIDEEDIEALLEDGVQVTTESGLLVYSEGSERTFFISNKTGSDEATLNDDVIVKQRIYVLNPGDTIDTADGNSYDYDGLVE